MSSPVATQPTVRRGPWICGRAAVMRWIAVLTIMGIAWRCVRYGMGFPIWGDEAFVAINFLRRDFAGMLKPLDYGQIVPVMLMWGQLAVTRLVGMSEWAVRLLPFLAGVASVLLFRRFALTILDRRAALLAVGIFAASYYPVRHGTEIKPYAFDLLMSLILTSLGWWVYQQPRAVGRWLLLTTAAAVSLWFSYTAAFVGAGVGLLLTYVLIRDRSGRVAILWLAYGVCLGASFVALYLICAKPHAEAVWAPGDSETLRAWGPGFPPIARPWLLPIWFLKNHTGNMTAYPIGGKNGGSTLTFVLVVIGVVMLWRRQRALLLLLLGPLPFTFIAAAMQRYPYGYSARLCQHVAPAFCLLAGLGLMGVFRWWLPLRRVPRAMGITVLVLASIAVIGTVSDLIVPYKTFPDYEDRRVLRVLAERAGPKDQWISFNVPDAKATYADNIYLRGGSGARHMLYLHWIAPVPLIWAPPPGEVVHPAGGRTWLIVYTHAKHTRVHPFPEKALSEYLEALARSSGPPQHHVFVIDEEQRIDVYEYPVTQGSVGSGGSVGSAQAR